MRERVRAGGFESCETINKGRVSSLPRHALLGPRGGHDFSKEVHSLFLHPTNRRSILLILILIIVVVVVVVVIASPTSSPSAGEARPVKAVPFLGVLSPAETLRPPKICSSAPTRLGCQNVHVHAARDADAADARAADSRRVSRRLRRSPRLDRRELPLAQKRRAEPFVITPCTPAERRPPGPRVAGFPVTRSRSSSRSGSNPIMGSWRASYRGSRASSRAYSEWPSRRDQRVLKCILCVPDARRPVRANRSIAARARR